MGDLLTALEVYSMILMVGSVATGRYGAGEVAENIVS